jgi:NADPH:quinone reductase-like Zn-dependent oxidoreductase
MKAIQIQKYGEADELHLTEIQRPKPSDNEVLVRIVDAGVNPFDWKVRRGYMKDMMPLQFPHTMGYDFAGEVAEVGSKITNFKSGDRVFGFTNGAYAEYGICSADKIAKLPPQVSFETAASLPTPALTAYQIIANNIRAHGANKILIHGAAGAVGSIAVQVAKSFGMTVFANAAKEDQTFLRELGVDQIVDYKTQRFEEQFKDLDAVVDLVGGDTLKRSFQIVKKGGLIVTTVGPVPEDVAKSAGIEAKFFLNNQNSTDLEQLAKLVGDGKIKVRIAEVMPLAKAAEAQRMNESGKAHGKIVLHVQ